MTSMLQPVDCAKFTSGRIATNDFYLQTMDFNPISSLSTQPTKCRG